MSGGRGRSPAFGRRQYPRYEQIDGGAWSASLSVCAGLRGLLDRFADADIGPTAANVAGHGIVDLGIARVRIARQQSRRRHDVPGLTIPALDNLEIEPCLLNLPASRRIADGLDGGDRRGAHAIDGRGTGTGGDAVHMDGAGAAERHPAAELRAGHAEHVAQHPQERGVTVDIDGPSEAVDLDCGGHSSLQAIRVDWACEE